MIAEQKLRYVLLRHDRSFLHGKILRRCPGKIISDPMKLQRQGNYVINKSTLQAGTGWRQAERVYAWQMMLSNVKRRAVREKG